MTNGTKCIIKPPTPPIVEIHGFDGRVLLSIHTNGTVEGDIEDASEAARMFVKEIRRLVALPTQSDALRDLVATLWCASGCSCCRDDDAWEKASHELAQLFGIPKFDDGSGYDWYSVCNAAQEQSK